MNLVNITPLILTCNEAPNIGRCLEKLAWARRIVVVDSFNINTVQLRLFCHPERSEGSAFPLEEKQILRQKTPQNDDLELN